MNCLCRARLACLLLLAPVPLVAQRGDVGLPSLTFTIPVDPLRDVAVAVYNMDHGVIYYNPRAMTALGPDLTGFFRQHELGHLYNHHIRGNALHDGGPEADSIMHASELQADCYAARTLTSGQFPAIDAAVACFSRRGNRHTPDHPSGAERAGMILSCVGSRELAVGSRELGVGSTRCAASNCCHSERSEESLRPGADCSSQWATAIG